ncbi:hypothetical protein M9Y10_030356 [Tritrichomonas musculus]|uniref:ELM2 domain-containing protein n=1 Tax=Tritrichomonas musculus TaxID=1915356 RepID=A0ABR2KPN9_9EUKA
MSSDNELPLHNTPIGSPQFQLSPNMQELTTQLHNWELDRDFTEEELPRNIAFSPKEEEFYTTINQTVEKQLEDHPPNPNRRGYPRPPNPLDEFGKSYHDRDDFENFLKTLDKNREYPSDELIGLYNMFFHTNLDIQKFGK